MGWHSLVIKRFGDIRATWHSVAGTVESVLTVPGGEYSGTESQYIELAAEMML